jgi:signal transduction histidine kinase/CheY-like chemotaxis protein
MEGLPVPCSGQCFISGGKERLDRALPPVLVALSALVLALWLYLCYDTGNSRLAIGLVAGSFFLGLAWSQRARPRLAAAILVACGVACAIALPRYAATSLAAPACFAIVLAGCLFGPAAAAAAAIAVVGGAAVLPGAAVSAQESFATLAIGALLCAGLLPWQEMLSLANRQAAEAARLVQRLREEQGKLRGTLKALDTAYALLESSNRALALARREAEELRQLKHRFAASLSHELRTPLNIILGFSELIYRRPGLYGFDCWPDALRRDLAQIQRNAGYLSGLLDDVLDLARLDASAMPVRREPHDLAEVVQQAVADIAGLAEEKRVELSVECEDRLPPVYLDEVRIRQVLYNLLSNALRVSEPGGKVTVSIRGEGECALVSVRDEGPGIPAEVREWIFDEYRQLERGGASEGKGLGLAIAKHFVLLHGGRIWVESEPGKGSTFFFTLPLQRISFSRLQEKSPLPPPTARLKPTLAVLGGSEESASYFRRRLEEFALATVADLPELLSRWEELRPAAVLCLHDQGSQKLEACASSAVRAFPKAVPVICCAAPRPWGDLVHRGFGGLLRKPVSETQLRQALEGIGAWREGMRVLIADDDRGFVQLLSRMLQASGSHPEVLAAYNGADALRAAKRERPDVILLDLVMPRLGGLEVLQALQQDEELRSVPVIAITAAQPADEGDGLRKLTVTAPGPWPEHYVMGLVRAALSSAPAQAASAGTG